MGEENFVDSEVGRPLEDPAPLVDPGPVGPPAPDSSGDLDADVSTPPHERERELANDRPEGEGGEGGEPYDGGDIPTA